jgi:SAM-dependent methyltransferase
MDGISNFNGLSILVPGSALGGECFAAIELGANKVTGLEIMRDLVLASEKYAKDKNVMNVMFLEFNGRKFPNNGYDIVVSGHVIEHSPDWKEHLNECIKVTRPNGKIYLEFPSRFHYKELHTGLISFEWLPAFLRCFMNLFSAKLYLWIGNKEKSSARYSIQNTLQQVSEREIRKYIKKKYHGSINIRSSSNPAPGIVRLIIY